MEVTFTGAAAASMRYCASVFTHALWLLQRPLGYFIFLWVLGLILGEVVHTIHALLCQIPGVSGIAFCLAPSPTNAQNHRPHPQRVDYPHLVEIQSTSWEQLLDQAAGGPTLTLEIKKAELATRDLIVLVKISDLKSRDYLARSLLEFVHDAKETSQGLHKLGAKINGAVDR